jgi:WS/DGAT/MGAT family acyltransferase
MAQMRAMDAAFLAMERRNEPRHLGEVMLFEPGDEGPLDHALVRRLVAQRLPRMASARRIVVNAPLGLNRPTWANAKPDLDVHVRQATLGRDGAPAELTEYVADAHAERLDRRRPLWELHVIDGLPDERVAIYAKVHLAALDDTTGVDLMTGLLDQDVAGESTIEPADVFAEGAASPTDLYERFVAPVPDQVRRAIGFPARLAGRAARAVGEQLPGLTETAAELMRRTPGMEAVAGMLPPPEEWGNGDEHPTGRAPRLSFNAPIGPQRTFAMTSLATEDVLRVKRESGASFNEIIIAVCTGALRRWLLAHDELPTSPVISIVPVLVGQASGKGAHVAAISLPLATNLADPADRLKRTHDALVAAKQRHAGVPASLQQDVAMFAPPFVSAITGRLLDAMPHRPFISPTVNLAITNVPGPRRQVYLAGRPLWSGHPVLSVSDLTPLHLGVQPGPERVGVGVVASRDHVPELHSLVADAPIELEALTAAVIPSRRRRRTSR